ncbi:MAG: GYD domain-containing protein [Mesorhizobium sp.]|uniref:GYD domain-containing protein n=1 Tax=Mesorhizobium sp. TaxID=1871066 RepID=UPI001200B141|nr:GYD domain-containing protein [Mesorhizobium sp.]TIM97157.1 MAG: GYD domain-containing protein [Mesorhizobium sp.]
MPMYLSRFSYTPETWARLIQNPEDRRAAARSYIESVGGKLHGFWYAFGEHDGWNLWEAPDNVSMASVVLAIGAGGALNSYETTVLLSVEETMEALGKAKSIRYRPPAS